ncbi:hypothetical protein BS47DRAFT_1335370 [Hydnum rufescens UP504]|uniref:Uncharacterized protein n=1 Tax=Hydnum rufescens UP504 TaxID=1448309 RepID=A0A9P6DZN6_9AGAM|nr:hypothetical protein BS47DRAFT_1335370 [Hydnum rufescens UP504]
MSAIVVGTEGVQTGAALGLVYTYTLPKLCLSSTNSEPAGLETSSETLPPLTIIPRGNKHVFWVDIARRRFLSSYVYVLVPKAPMTSTALQSSRTRKYATFVDDPTTPDDENLVMRWNDACAIDFCFLSRYLIEICRSYLIESRRRHHVYRGAQAERRGSLPRRVKEMPHQ